LFENSEVIARITIKAAKEYEKTEAKKSPMLSPQQRKAKYEGFGGPNLPQMAGFVLILVVTFAWFHLVCRLCYRID
jgi:hypothetical protein